MENTSSKLASSFPVWRNLAKTSSLFVSVGVLLAIQTSCGGETYETVPVVDTIKTVELNQGIVTTVKEVAPNQFEIQKEETVPSKADTRVIVQKLNGQVDTFTTEQIKTMVSAQDSVAGQDTTLRTASKDPNSKTTAYQSGYSPTMHTLGYVLMGGAMGYFLGKSLSMPPNPNVYRYPQQQYYQNQPYSYSGGGGGGSSYRYGGGSSSSSASSSPYSSLKSTATTNTRTVTSYKTVSTGRSGFFGGRSSGGGSRSYSG